MYSEYNIEYSNEEYYKIYNIIMVNNKVRSIHMFKELLLELIQFSRGYIRRLKLNKIFVSLTSEQASVLIDIYNSKNLI